MNISKLANEQRIKISSQSPLPDAIFECLHYNQNTGIITCARKYSTRSVVGAEVGTLNPDGYRRIQYKNKVYMAHRVAWLLHYGSWPDKEVDHVDGNKLNNAISNLRCVHTKDNCKNRGVSKHNKTGHPGVQFDSATGKWRVQFRINKKNKHFGLFEDFNEAVDVAREQYIHHGFSERHSTGLDNRS